MTLTEFLLARIAEDEAVARAAIERDGDHWATESLGHDGSRINGTVDKGNPRAYSGSPELWDDEGALGMHDETAAHIVRWDPARVLRECAAKRRIVKWAEGPYKDTQDAVRYQALRYLALPCADRSGYRDEWKP